MVKINEFTHKTFGKCIILKTNLKNNFLVYSVEKDKYLIVTNLDLINETWLKHKSYNEDLDKALISFNNL